MRLLTTSIKIALLSIRANKIRAFLTMLGIVLGVFTISMLLSLAFGVRKEITSQIEGLGSNFLAITPGKITDSKGGLNPSAALGASTLTEKDYQALKDNLPKLKNLSMAMLITGGIKATDTMSNSSLIFASSEHILPLLNTTIDQGRFLTNADLEQKEKVVVLGAKSLKTLFPDGNFLNKEVSIRGTIFTVIGSLKEKEDANNFLGPALSDVVIMPITSGWELTNTRQIFRIMMQAPDSASVKEYKKKVHDQLLANHGGEEDFTVITQDDALGIVGNILTILTAMIGAIALLSLVIGGLGIMNIMLVSITERTKEIGIRKAVGANKTHILIQFLIEALTLSLLGGLVGIMVSGVIVLVVNHYAPFKLDFSWMVVMISLGFSFLIGVVFGVAPALKAAGKDPISAIRSE